MTVAPIVPGMYLGVGCDSLTGKVNGEALLFEPAQTIEDAGGQETEFNLRIIEGSSQLAQALNVSASASFSGYGFSASAEAKYLSEQEVSKYSLYALISVRVNNPDRVIRNRRLKPEAYQLLAERGWDEFENIYGAEYMSGVTTGGSYYGLIQIETEDFSERQELAAKISGSGWGGKLSTEVEQELKQLFKNKKISITVLQSGGSGDVLETTLEEMIEQAKNFPQLIKDDPVAYRGIFAEYRSSVLLPPDIEPGTFDRQHQLNVLEELGRKYLEYKDLRSDLDFILRNRLNFEEYQDLSDEEWQPIQGKLQQDFAGVSTQINQLVEQARSCRASFKACQLPTQYYQLTTELPTIEGQTMVLKQMEENLRNLQLQVTSLKNTVSNDPLKKVITNSRNNVGIGTTNPQAKLHVSGGTGSVGLILEADTDNVGESHQPSITLKQDGGQVTGQLGYFGGNNNLQLANRFNKGSSITLLDNNNLDLNGNVTVKGKKPFQVRRYGPFKGNTSYNTNYSTNDWEAVIGGFRALNGDIQEDDRGNMIQVYTTVKSGKWHVFADFRSHNRNEDWYVWVLFISKSLIG